MSREVYVEEYHGDAECSICREANATRRVCGIFIYKAKMNASFRTIVTKKLCEDCNERRIDEIFTLPYKVICKNSTK